MTDHPKELCITNIGTRDWLVCAPSTPNAIRYVPATDLDAARREVWEMAIKQAEGTPKFGYGQTTKEAIISNLRAARDAAGGEKSGPSDHRAQRPPADGLPAPAGEGSDKSPAPSDFTFDGHHRATYWMIEWPADKNLPVRWWNPNPDKGWMIDPNEGLQFCRQKDAENYRASMRFGQHTTVTEHVFLAPSPPEPPKMTQEEVNRLEALDHVQTSDGFDEDFPICKNVLTIFAAYRASPPDELSWEVVAPPKALQNLREHQTQLDQDGCFVGVSRQALTEVLDHYAALIAYRGKG